MNWRYKIAKYIASEYIEEVDNRVNQRVAETLSKINVLDYVLKDYFATFSAEYERPEDRLDERGKLSMAMWANQLDKDPNFEYLISWIMDHHSNDMVRHGAVTPERILYGRAQIASSELFKREVKRLSSIYQDYLKNNGPKEFDPHSVIGD